MGPLTGEVGTGGDFIERSHRFFLPRLVSIVCARGPGAGGPQVSRKGALLGRSRLPVARWGNTRMGPQGKKPRLGFGCAETQGPGPAPGGHGRPGGTPAARRPGRGPRGFDQPHASCTPRGPGDGRPRRGDLPAGAGSGGWGVFVSFEGGDPLTPSNLVPAAPGPRWQCCRGRRWGGAWGCPPPFDGGGSRHGGTAFFFPRPWRGGGGGNPGEGDFPAGGWDKGARGG